jgi:hypothetical protein
MNCPNAREVEALKLEGSKRWTHRTSREGETGIRPRASTESLILPCSPLLCTYYTLTVVLVYLSVRVE